LEISGSHLWFISAVRFLYFLFFTGFVAAGLAEQRCW